jgi:glycine/D-amino acid oxidase-like deaminating enzyme
VHDDAQIVCCPEEGWVDPVLYAGTMLRAAQERYGAVLKTGVKVMRLETQNGRVVGARDQAGEIHAADLVINCTGRWSNETVNSSAPNVPLAPTVGFLVFTPPVGIDLRRPFHAPDLDVRPDGAGRLMLRKDSLDDCFSALESRQPDCQEAALALASAAELLPGLRGVQAEAVRTTLRPIPADGLSTVGPVRGVDGYYVVVTHSGVTLSPFLGHAVADEVIRGNERPELHEFRPDRFQV